MKLKHIILGLLIILTPIPNYLFLRAYYTLSSEEFFYLTDKTGYGVFLSIYFILSCCGLFALIIGVIIHNWEKTITLNSILKTIKSIKLN